ncbi:MAG: DUF3995 domain-containing protein [Pseudomonadota bacterium]
MTALAITLFIALLGIAVAHALWGLRIWWPVSDERTLARTVVGAASIERMPPAHQCIAVTLVMITVAALTLQLGGISKTTWATATTLSVAGFAASAVFVLRGIAGFLPFWAKLTPEQPFRRYDQWMYSPLSLMLGIGIFILSQNFSATVAG